MQEQTEVVSWSGPVNDDLSGYNGLLVLPSVCPKFQCPGLQFCKYMCVLWGTCNKLLGEKSQRNPSTALFLCAHNSFLVLCENHYS